MELKGDLLTLFALQDVSSNPQVAKKQLAELVMPKMSKNRSTNTRQTMISPQRRQQISSASGASHADMMPYLKHHNNGSISKNNRQNSQGGSNPHQKQQQQQHRANKNTQLHTTKTRATGGPLMVINKTTAEYHPGNNSSIHNKSSPRTAGGNTVGTISKLKSSTASATSKLPPQSSTVMSSGNQSGSWSRKGGKNNNLEALQKPPRAAVHHHHNQANLMEALPRTVAGGVAAEHQFVMRSLPHHITDPNNKVMAVFPDHRGSNSSQTANRLVIPLAHRVPPQIMELRNQSSPNQKTHQAYRDSQQSGFYYQQKQASSQPRSKIEQRKRTSNINILLAEIEPPATACAGVSSTMKQMRQRHMGIGGQAVEHLEEEDLDGYMWENRVQSGHHAQSTDYSKVEISKARGGEGRMPRSQGSTQQVGHGVSAVHRKVTPVLTTAQIAGAGAGIKKQSVSTSVKLSMMQQSQQNNSSGGAPFRQQQNTHILGQATISISSPNRRHPLTLASVEEKASFVGGGSDILQHRQSKMEDSGKGGYGHNDTSALLTSMASSQQRTKGGASRMNHNASSLGDRLMAVSSNASNKNQQRQTMQKFKTKNVANRIRQQKQVRRFQQYSNNNNTSIDGSTSQQYDLDDGQQLYSDDQMPTNSENDGIADQNHLNTFNTVAIPPSETPSNWPLHLQSQKQHGSSVQDRSALNSLFDQPVSVTNLNNNIIDEAVEDVEEMTGRKVLPPRQAMVSFGQGGDNDSIETPRIDINMGNNYPTTSTIQPQQEEPQQQLVQMESGEQSLSARSFLQMTNQKQNVSSQQHKNQQLPKKNNSDEPEMKQHKPQSKKINYLKTLDELQKQSHKNSNNNVLLPEISGHHSARSIVASPKNGGTDRQLQQQQQLLINQSLTASQRAILALEKFDSTGGKKHYKNSDKNKNHNQNADSQTIKTSNQYEEKKQSTTKQDDLINNNKIIANETMATDQYLLQSMIKTPRQIRYENQQLLVLQPPKSSQQRQQQQQPIERQKSSVSLNGNNDQNIIMQDLLQKSINSSGKHHAKQKIDRDAYQITIKNDSSSRQYSPQHHLMSQRPKHTPGPSSAQTGNNLLHTSSIDSTGQQHKFKNKRASKDSIKQLQFSNQQQNNSRLVRKLSSSLNNNSNYHESSKQEDHNDSNQHNNPYEVIQQYTAQQLIQKATTNKTPLLGELLPSSQISLYQQLENSNGGAVADAQIGYSHPIPGQYNGAEAAQNNLKSINSSANQHRDRFEQWDVAGLGAVPYAINSGTKNLIFRAYYGQGITMNDVPKPPLNKGFFYKFNSNLEIKLIKYTLEDNGLCEYQHINKHQLLPNQAKSVRDQWILMWTTQSLKSGFYANMTKYQKVNHFPRSIELTRKDFLANRIHRMQDAHGKHHFNFWPRTFVLPKETDSLIEAMEANSSQYWICKPNSMAQGKGIFITNQPRDVMKVQSAIVSHYISNPLTVDKLKFDLRIYVAVTSLSPLRIYMYDEGLVRFATAEYQAPTQDGVVNQKNRFIHLTNYSINKNNKHGSIAEHAAKDEACGSKWSFKALRQVLREHQVNDERLFGRIKDIVIKTIISSEPVLYNAYQMHVPNRNNCFQMFGFDVMIDDELNPWLLEVNLSPSLACDSPLDHRIKSHLVADLFNLAGIVNLDQSQQGLQNQSNMQSKKQNKMYSANNGGSVYGQNQSSMLVKPAKSNNKKSSNRERQFGSIAAHLTSSVSHSNNNRVNGEAISKKEEILLREAEIEFKRKGRFSLIFPANGTNIYKSYFEEPRHINSLLHKRCVERGLFSQLRQQDRQRATSTIDSQSRMMKQKQQQQQQQHIAQNINPTMATLTQESFVHVD